MEIGNEVHGDDKQRHVFFLIKEGIRREVNVTKEEALSKGQGREVIFAATFG